MSKIYPLNNLLKRQSSELSRWQFGSTKPAIDGNYLRRFDEGQAVSEFHNGVWLRDGFFESDVQDAPWRGMRAVS